MFMQTLPNISSYPESTAVGSGTISVFVTNLGKYNEGELVANGFLCQQHLNK